MKLLFDQTRLPRTMTREGWKECDRWRRTTQRKLSDETERRIEWMRAYGTSHPEIALSVAEDIINPPVLLGQYQE